MIDMLSIDEAIAHARKVAEEQRELFRLCPYPSQECNGADICKCLKNKHDGCIKCAKEHEQLAEWLEELKAYREKKCDKSVYLASKSVDKIDAVNKGYIDGYNKAIDDCKELTFREVVYCDSLNDRTEFRELAEQLKAKNNERKGVTEK